MKLSEIWATYTWHMWVLFGITVLVGICCVVAIIASSKPKKKKEPFSKTEVLHVPIEVWSEFGAVCYSLCDYWDSRKADGGKEAKFDFIVQEDIFKDCLWLKYTVRDENLYKFVQKEIDRCNCINSSYRKIDRYDGVPEHYLGQSFTRQK